MFACFVDVKQRAQFFKCTSSPAETAACMGKKMQDQLQLSNALLIKFFPFLVSLSRKRCQIKEHVIIVNVSPRFEYVRTVSLSRFLYSYAYEMQKIIIKKKKIESKHEYIYIYILTRRCTHVTLKSLNFKSIIIPDTLIG
jgi:hypothetical protein